MVLVHSFQVVEAALVVEYRAEVEEAEHRAHRVEAEVEECQSAVYWRRWEQAVRSSRRLPRPRWLLKRQPPCHCPRSLPPCSCPLREGRRR